MFVLAVQSAGAALVVVVVRVSKPSPWQPKIVDCPEIPLFSYWFSCSGEREEDSYAAAYRRRDGEHLLPVVHLAVRHYVPASDPHLAHRHPRCPGTCR